MLIDEQRHHVLTKYVTKKGITNHVESDHNILYSSFNIKYTKKQPIIKREIFNFKNQEAQEKFKMLTANTNKFSLSFDSSKSIEKNSNKFFKTLDDAFHSCFKKIRIKSKTTKIASCEIQAELNIVDKLKMDINRSQSIKDKQF